MASALQCPACGFKHRLSGLSGEPVFACEQCGRLLKTPAEYLRPEPSGPSEPPRPSAAGRVQRGGSAARDQTSVIPASGAAGAAGAAAARPRRPAPRPQAPVALPLRILAWIAAIGIGAYIVRWLARVIGWLTGDSLIDVITGSGIGRYFRIFALVPFWALASALLATLFIEGGRWWARRRHGPPGRPARPAARRVPVPKPPAAKKPAPKPRQPAPRAPAPNPAPAPAQGPAEPRAPVQSPAAVETRSPGGAAGAPKARRIPRRDVSP